MMRMLRGRGLPARRARPDRRPARRLRHARRRRAAHGRPLLHVRRQAGRPGRVDRRRPGRRRSSTSRASARCVMGRGAVNQKGPESAFLAALHAIRGAGREAAGQPRAGGRGRGGNRLAALRADRPRGRRSRRRSSKCVGIFMPCRAQDRDGSGHGHARRQGRRRAASWSSSGEKWGRGPAKDVHSSNRARLDSPAWHLVQALQHAGRRPNGNPAIDGFADTVRPVSAAEKAMLDEAAQAASTRTTAKKQLGVDALGARRELARRRSRISSRRPTREHRGPGRRLHRPGRQDGPAAPGGREARPAPGSGHDASDDAVAKLKAHLAKRGFGDIEVNATGGYDPTSTSADAPLIQAELAVYRGRGHRPDPLAAHAAAPGRATCSPAQPLKLPPGTSASATASGAHAPDEYFLVELERLEDRRH